MYSTRIYEANELPQEFHEALERWRVKAREILRSDEIQWPAKLASTDFTYHGKQYSIIPEDVYSKQDFENNYLNYLHAGFEILQGTITQDLIALGAENIKNYGFID